MITLKQCHDQEEWDNYILENNGHPLQLWGWGEVKATHGWRAVRLQLHNETEVIGAAQVLIKRLPRPLRSYAYIPRGPVVDDENREELLNQLASYIKRYYHSVALSIEPDSIEYSVPKGWKKTANRILPPETIILDLNQSEAELMAVMAKKTRQYIRKSAADIKVKTVKNGEELKKCLDLYHQTAKRAGFDIHSDQYYYDIFDKLGDYSQVFAAYVDDQPVAFLWVVISAETAFELYGGVNEQGQELRANYALKWHAIKKCKEWGLGCYDFGGLIDGGVTTFKKGWAEGETVLVGTFDKPLSWAYVIWNRGLPTGKKIVRRLKRIVRR